MNCANHPETAAAAYCRDCGKPMCRECERPALGSVYCGEHAPAAAAPAAATPGPPPPLPSWSAPSPGFAGSPYAAPPTVSDADPNVHPTLALILGFVPGVGAIYNGQYAKGLIHAVIFGLMISLLNNIHYGGSQAFVGIMLGVWVIYQAFEAYHTARKRKYGIAVEEFSSLLEPGHTHGRLPVGAILLIAVGFLLLLDTTDVINMDQIERYWPAGLILLGVYLLYARLNPGTRSRDAEVRQ